jgi:hypothetical protein
VPYADLGKSYPVCAGAGRVLAQQQGMKARLQRRLAEPRRSRKARVSIVTVHVVLDRAPALGSYAPGSCILVAVFHSGCGHGLFLELSNAT